ncbi:hypothetical protein [Methylobacterium tarhaniae]|uniref:hypothetical protein n=1 Tax=Methylobacterium tarhaniae TaxID=1187852 RepID=UPI003CFC8A20
MAEMELVGGHFGTGRGRYRPGEFRLPGRITIPVEQVASAEENASFIQRNIGSSLRSMIGGGLGLAPVAMLAGLFVAPLAMVGAIGVTAAAIGAGLGALGAGDKRVLMQVVLDDGRGFICVCDEGVAAQVQYEAQIARRAAEDRRAAQAALIPQKWRMGPVTPPAPATGGSPRLLAPPEFTPVPALEGPPSALPLPADNAGLLAAAGSALSATTSLAADGAAKAGAAAETAYATATAAADGAWKAATSLFSRRREEG